MAAVERSIGETIGFSLDDPCCRRTDDSPPPEQSAGFKDRERIIAMAYGLSTRMFLEREPTRPPQQSSSAAYAGAWPKLRREERIELIDRFLNAA